MDCKIRYPSEGRRQSRVLHMGGRCELNRGLFGGGVLGRLFRCVLLQLLGLGCDYRCMADCCRVVGNGRCLWWKKNSDCSCQCGRRRQWRVLRGFVRRVLSGCRRRFLDSWGFGTLERCYFEYSHSSRITSSGPWK